MGSGNWDRTTFATYTTTTKSCTLDELENLTTKNGQSFYKKKTLSPILNPYHIKRECCDTDEHPHTIPVILAIDVTGSMGGASVQVAKKLNTIMEDLYNNVKDVEFCIMGIGDLRYDSAPIQMSQFESDIRIAEQLDELYFEGGGGGNAFESYTAAWYMGLRHCALDCWKRGEKGIIITLGDEQPNPYLPEKYLCNATGDKLQDDVETADLYKEVCEKFNIYHISVDDPDSSYRYYQNNLRLGIDEKWTELLGKENYKICNLDNLAKTITDIIINNNNTVVHIADNYFINNKDNVITW